MKILDFEIKKTNKQKVVEEISKADEQLVNKSLEYSMCTTERMWCLIQSFNHVISKNIEGDFVECGVWKGGNILLLKNLLERDNLRRKIYCYDTFEGMPPPTKEDVKYNGVDGLKIFKQHEKENRGFCYSELDEVKSNITNNCKDLNGIVFIKGKVEDTLKENRNLPEKISILRLDTDFYTSTKSELEILFPRLQKGGILIIDDYGFWKGAKQAVDEYFKNKNPFLIRIDHSCRLLINY